MLGKLPRIALILSAMLFSIALAICEDARQGTQTSVGLDWPRWRGVNGDGVSSETAWNPKALQGNVKVLWKANVGIGFSGVVIQNNRLYMIGLAGSENIVVCLDAHTGGVIWKNSIKGAWAPPQSTLTIDGDRLYCVTQNSGLFCLSLANGKIVRKSGELWRRLRPARGHAASPVVADTLLLVNASSDGMAFDKMTGAVKWEMLGDHPKESWGSIATPAVSEIGGVRNVIFLGPVTLSAMDLATGKRL